MEDDFDKLIKEFLTEKMLKDKHLPSKNCPSELELSDYLDGSLSQERENWILEHIAACPDCLALLEIAQEAKDQAKNIPPENMIMRAKNISQRKPKRTFLNYKWQLLAAISFSLSFVFTRYFLQFLILAVISSVKWIFDTGSTRTLIMIYEAWRKKDKNSAQRIIREFQDKIEQRK